MTDMTDPDGTGLLSATPAVEGQDEFEPLRVLVFDTQTTCIKLFTKSLSNYLKLGQLNHPYVVAATLVSALLGERVTWSTGRRIKSRSAWNIRLSGRCADSVVHGVQGPERIHTKIGNEETRQLWRSRVAAAPDRVKATTHESATNKFLLKADEIEQKVRRM